MSQRERMVVLCADDFGLAPGVSEAILFLVEHARLSATSCMTVASDWPRAAALLQPLSATIDVGLHLTLTTLSPLGPMPVLAPQGRLPSLPGLMRAAFTGQLNGREIGTELRRQLDAFMAAFGREPDFIDGHQHVHVLPTIRNETLALLQNAALTAAGTYLRIPWEHPARILKRGTSRRRSLVIAGLSLQLAQQARAQGVLANQGFGGVRDFDPRMDYRHFFQRTLSGLGANSIIMCHPGHVDAALCAVDAVTTTRAQEFAYFASDAFSQDLAAANCRLTRFRAMTSQR